jgi:hypothetical protein
MDVKLQVERPPYRAKKRTGKKNLKGRISQKFIGYANEMQQRFLPVC